MAAIYRQGHPERTVLYRVLATHFDTFLTRYETLFQGHYGYFRPVVREVVERYLDCANPMCWFARARCPDCGGEYLLTFSCKTRHFCPSCHAKRREAWSIWLNRHLLVGLPHRQVVFTIPKMVRPFFRYRRALLSDLCLCAVRAIGQYMKARAGRVLMPGVAAVIQIFGNRLNFHPHLHMLVTEGGRSSAGLFHPVPIFNDAALAHIFAHEVMIRYYGLYSNAHRGMERKRGKATSDLPVLTPPPPGRASPGWRELISKVYEVDPLTCPACGAEMRVIAFITDYEVIDRIIHHLGITFRSTRPPPTHQQEELY